MKTRTKKILELMLGFCIILSLLFITYYVSVNDLFTQENQTTERGYVQNVTLVINGSNWTQTYFAENTTNITAATLLFEWADYMNISIEKKYWSGYNSYLISSVGNNTNGDNEYYWQYYVNDNYADVGCSKYVILDDDIIHWKFEPSKWK